MDFYNIVYLLLVFVGGVLVWRERTKLYGYIALAAILAFSELRSVATFDTASVLRVLLAPAIIILVYVLGDVYRKRRLRMDSHKRDKKSSTTG